jgi:hypothetical protein
MAKIERPDGAGIGPVYDLDRSETLDRLDALAGPAGAATAELEDIQAFEKLLGLKEVAPQAGALAPPAHAEHSLATQSGAQVRGALRKMAVNLQFNAQQLRALPAMQSDRPEVQSVQNRLGYVERLVGHLDSVLANQDSILGRLASEQKT